MSSDLIQVANAVVTALNTQLSGWGYGSTTAVRRYAPTFDFKLLGDPKCTVLPNSTTTNRKTRGLNVYEHRIDVDLRQRSEGDDTVNDAMLALSEHVSDYFYGRTLSLVPSNEVQKITFSAAPAYGKGTFTGPASESIVVDFSQNLAAEQAAFTAAMATNYPTVARPSGTVHTFTFETGSNAGTNVTQMTFTRNTTDYPLRNASGSTATLTKTQDGDGNMQANVYELTPPNGEYGSLVLGDGTFAITGLGDTTPATISDSGNTWTVSYGAGIWTITSSQTVSQTLSSPTSQTWGTLITGTMSTTNVGGVYDSAQCITAETSPAYQSEEMTNKKLFAAAAALTFQVVRAPK